MTYAAQCEFEKRPLHRSIAGAALAASALLAAAAGNPCLAGPSQTGFSSPDEASRALVSAAEEHDERTVIKILGGSELVRSDDTAEDVLEREHFVQKYREMHRWVREPGGVATLYIGAENWPFPIPLASRDGAWRFDSKAGSEEILFRRIGENEVTAIVTCDTLVKPGTQPGTDTEANRLLQTLHSRASKPNPFHGYYFRTVPNSGGGIAAVAYPAIYRSSGVMTIIATRDGVSEKDLGAGSEKIVQSMTTYHADSTWRPVEAAP